MYIAVNSRATAIQKHLEEYISKEQFGVQVSEHKKVHNELKRQFN